jgi:hypothetical protein
MKDQLESVFRIDSKVVYCSIDQPHNTIPRPNMYYIDYGDQVAKNSSFTDDKNTLDSFLLDLIYFRDAVNHFFHRLGTNRMKHY